MPMPIELSMNGRNDTVQSLPFELDKQYLGNCLQKLKLLPDECIDFVFTSPPYMAGKVYEDESCKDKGIYVETLRKIFTEIARVLTPDGTFALEWGYGKDTDGPGTAVPFMYYMYDDLKEMGFLIKHQIVWHYPGGNTGSSSKKHQRLFARYECIYCLTKNPAASYLDITESRDIRLNRTLDKKNNQFGRNPSDVWKTFPSGEIIEKLIENVEPIRNNKDIDSHIIRLDVADTLVSEILPGLPAEIERALASEDPVGNIQAMFLDMMYPSSIDKLINIAVKSRTKPRPDDHWSGTLDPLVGPLLGCLNEMEDDPRSDVWELPTFVVSKDAKWHPCHFPLPLADRAIRIFCRPGGLVLDPFGGSGMTGKAALLAGRRFLSFELDEAYNTVANEEIEALKRILSGWRCGRLEEWCQRNQFSDKKRDRVLYPYPDHDPLTCMNDPACRLKCRRRREKLAELYLEICGRIVDKHRTSGLLSPKQRTEVKSGRRSRKRNSQDTI